MMKILRKRGLRKFAFVRMLINASKPSKIKLNDYFLYINRQDNSLLPSLKDGIYEKEETDFFKKCIVPGDTVVDIGANIGYFTMLASSLGGEVHSFEPEPKNVSLLRKNVRENNAHAHVFEMALGDTDGLISLYLNDFNMGDHRIYDSNNGRESVLVKIGRLDTVLPNLSPKLVKIDTQGAEVAVLRGGRELFSRTKYLCMEYWPYGLNMAGTSGEDLLKEVRNLGFTFPDFDTSLYTVENEQFCTIYGER